MYFLRPGTSTIPSPDIFEATPQPMMTQIINVSLQMEMAGLARSSDSIGETEMESLQFSGNKPRVSRLFLDAKGLLSAGLFSLAFSASSYTHISRRRSISGGENDFRKAFFSLVYFPFLASEEFISQQSRESRPRNRNESRKTERGSWIWELKSRKENRRDRELVQIHFRRGDDSGLLPLLLP